MNPHRLAARGLALSDVVAALGKSRALQIVGRMQDHAKLLLLAIDNTVPQVEQLHTTVISGGEGCVVRLSDVAAGWRAAMDAGQRRRTPTVQFQVYQQPNANMVSISAYKHKRSSVMRGEF